MPSGSSLTPIVAWVGAITGGIALLWDIYKWRRRGPRIVVEVAPDMLMTGAAKQYVPDDRVLVVIATNLGDRPTTLTQMVGCWYRTRLQRIRRRPEETLIMIPLDVVGQSTPHLLNPGEQWRALIGQNKLAPYLNAGRLECGVLFAGSKKCLRLVRRRSTSNKALNPSGANAPRVNARD